MKKKLLIGALALTLGASHVMPVWGNQRFTDVPTDHWAHDAIINMSDSGFMVGNSAGAFRPYQPLDKFETARILAGVAGFRHIGNTPEQQAFNDQAYENQRELLSELEGQFERWNSASNREIAFLLEKGILTPADLQQFIVIFEGTENLRALSRGEAAIFLVRAVDLVEQAHRGVFSELFYDDTAIPAASRIYVYFLRAHGVVSGDETGSFRANSPVTRAAFAIMLDRAMLLGYALSESDAASEEEGEGINPPALPQGNLSGQVTVIFQAIGALQIETGATSVIHRVAPDANLLVNGALASFSDIEEGMNVVVTIENNQIVHLTATEGTGPAPMPTPLPIPVPAPGSGTEVAPAPTTPEFSPSPAPQQPAQPNLPNVYTTLQAVVTEVEPDHGRLIIEMAFITPAGVTETQEMAFQVANNTTIIYMGAETARLSDIVAGDLVTLRVSGGLAHTIQVVERTRSFRGVVEERIRNADTNTLSYTIRDEDNILSTFVVGTASILEREGSGRVNWEAVRIGDTVEVVTEQNQIINLFAFGGGSTVEGVVEEVTLRQDLSRLVISQGGILQTYYITGTLEGMNQVQIGQRVRLRLESREVEGITILN